MDWHISESPFWYDQVTVRQNDGGKKVYYFNCLLSNWTNNLGTGLTNGQLPDSDWTFGMPSLLNTIFSKGILLEKEQAYKNDGSQHNLVRTVENRYFVFNNETENPIHDLAIKRRVSSSAPGQLFAPDVIMDEAHTNYSLSHSRYYNDLV